MAEKERLARFPPKVTFAPDRNLYATCARGNMTTWLDVVPKDVWQSIYVHLNLREAATLGGVSRSCYRVWRCLTNHVLYTNAAMVMNMQMSPISNAMDHDDALSFEVGDCVCLSIEHGTLWKQYRVVDTFRRLRITQRVLGLMRYPAAITFAAAWRHVVPQDIAYLDGMVDLNIWYGDAGFKAARRKFVRGNDPEFMYKYFYAAFCDHVWMLALQSPLPVKEQTCYVMITSKHELFNLSTDPLSYEDIWSKMKRDPNKMVEMWRQAPLQRLPVWSPITGNLIMHVQENQMDGNMCVQNNRIIKASSTRLKRSKGFAIN